MDKPIYVAFSTQKGGAGKTTVTVLVASYLHYVKGYNVAVIDCDFPQYSVHDMRERDKEAAVNDLYYRRMMYEQIKKSGKSPYPVICCRPENAMETASELCRSEEKPDIIFFDMPGTVNNVDIIETIANMDYIFTPIIADRVVMESSIKFATVLNEHVIGQGKGKIKSMHLIWNMVDGREKSELYEFYDNAISMLSLSVLKTRLPDSKRFRKETGDKRKIVFRSTIFPADKTLVRGSGLDKLAEEIIGIIKGKGV